MDGLYIEKKEFSNAVGKNLETYPFLMPYATTASITNQSLNVYMNRFTQFIQFLTNTYHQTITCLDDFRKVTIQHINTFINENTDSSSTKKSKYYALNSLFGYLTNTDIIKDNPMDSIEIPKVENNTKLDYLSSREVKSILRFLEKESRAANTSTRQLLTRRDLVLFSLALNTGLKPSLLLDINIENVQDKKLIVLDMDIKLDKQTKEYLDQYLAFLNLDTGPLFLGQNKKRLTVRAYEKILDSYEDIIKRKVNPQLIRATFAHNALQANKSPIIVAKQMGISPVTLVSRYLSK